MTRMRSRRKPLLKNETSKAAGIRDRGSRRSHRKQKAKPIRIEASAAAEVRGRGLRRSYPEASESKPKAKADQHHRDGALLRPNAAYFSGGCPWQYFW
ncbi:hypothetical protein [Lysobacter sp. Root559]|uniref:hypothetical protein n=1 Tax=Lysobacter sp. Root559 TaxID=1736559 RepID=UPI0012FA32C4|nr:hypothetical protein [Lysobacter sp. Root559]